MFRNTHPNVWKIMAIKIIRWFFLIMPVITLYFNSLGLDMTEIYMLQSIFAFTIVIVEVPSGYLADLFSRKMLLIIGTLLGAVGFFTMGLASGFADLVIAELMLAFSVSFMSGSDSAILYDTLLEDSQEEEFVKWNGRAMGIGNFSESVAGILGGLLAMISLNTPALVQGVLALFSVAVAATLYEPKRKKIKVKESTDNIKKVIRLIKGNRSLFRWIIFSTVASAVTLLIAWIVQEFFIQNELPKKWFGLMWAIVNLFAAIPSWYSHKFKSALSEWGFIYLILSLLIIGLVGLSLISGWFGLIFFFLIYIARGIGNPIYTDFINRYTPSDIRATVLSIKSLGLRLLFALYGPLYGYINEHISMQMAMGLTLILFLLFSGAVLFFWRKADAAG